MDLTSILRSLCLTRDDFTVSTRCRLKGHVVNGKILDGLEPGNDWEAAECEKCHFPVYVRRDPENKEYYIIVEELYE